MTDEQEENTVRLLNIIDSIALLNKDQAHLEPPFSVNERGGRDIEWCPASGIIKAWKLWFIRLGSRKFNRII